MRHCLQAHPHHVQSHAALRGFINNARTPLPSAWQSPFAVVGETLGATALERVFARMERHAQAASSQQSDAAAPPSLARSVGDASGPTHALFSEAPTSTHNFSPHSSELEGITTSTAALAHDMARRAAPLSGVIAAPAASTEAETALDQTRPLHSKSRTTGSSIS